MAVENGRIDVEIAHVLFVDLVGYGLHSFEDQARITTELRGIVRQTSEFIRADKAGELLCGDTGDGMSLTFFRDPLAPVQCAMEIAQALRAYPHLRLRMGIHSGPVSRVADINGKTTVTGSGINMGQRVMDCGDAGHILMSDKMANVLSEFDSYAGSFIDLGVVRVKHDIPLHLYNLVHNGVGNPELPARITALKLKAEKGIAPELSSAPVTPLANPFTGKGQRLVLLYKRKDNKSERLLELLGTFLKKHGFEVFIDRHMKIGEEAMKHLASEIRQADAVIPLISESAIHSEVLEWEVDTAAKAQLERGGKPRLLPIRVAYEGPLTPSLEGHLHALQYALWETERDDERVMQELLQALSEPTKPTAIKRRRSGDGAIPLDSEFYVVRPTDDEFADAIDRKDSIVLVKGGRQMGKTSLLARGLQQARNNGAKVVFTDFQSLSSEHLTSADTLYRELANMICDELGLDVSPEENWKPGRGANMNLERYLRKSVLETINAPLVWGLDEVDRLFGCSFGTEVFGLFRSWHNRRATDPSGPWSRLTLAIAYATEAHLFIQDLNQSPFNVGTRLALSDFDLAQVSDLNRRYGSPLRTESELQRFHALIGGQPYLTSRGLDEMAARGLGIAEFERLALQEGGLYDDHLRRILFSLSQDKTRLEVTHAVLHGEPIPNAESFYLLRGAGVVVGESAQAPRLRCRLYQEYLARHLGSNG